MLLCYIGVSWTIVLKNTHITPDTIPKWYLVSFYAVFQHVSNLGIGDIYPLVENEGKFICPLMYVGYLITSIALPGILIVLFMNIDEPKAKFAAKVMANDKNHFFKSGFISDIQFSIIDALLC